MATDSIVSAGTSISTSTCAGTIEPSHEFTSAKEDYKYEDLSQHDLMFKPGPASIRCPSWDKRTGYTWARDLDTIEHSKQARRKKNVRKSSRKKQLQCPSSSLLFHGEITFHILSSSQVEAPQGDASDVSAALVQEPAMAAMAHVVPWTNHHAIRSFGIAATSDVSDKEDMSALNFSSNKIVSSSLHIMQPPYCGF